MIPADDASERFSLIEMDTPPKLAPGVRQAIPVVKPAPCAACGGVGRVCSERGVWDRCTTCKPATARPVAVTRQPIATAVPAAPARPTSFADTGRPSQVAADRAASERRAAEAAAPTTCVCPQQTRPLAIFGQCPACKLPRPRPPRQQAPVNPVTAETAQVARALNVQTSARSTADVTTVTATPDGIMRRSELVAGAKVDGAGIFLGFGGLGSLTRASIAAVLAEAGLPAEWLPAAKSAHAQAGRAVGELNGLGYIVRAARVAKTDPVGVARTWKARWTVGVADSAAVIGGRFGRTVLTVTLGGGNELRVEGDPGLAARVLSDFNASVEGEIYAAADVTAWLHHTLVSRFRAARVGGNWYVRAKYAVDAERLLTVIARGWGRDWLLPAIPMATSEQLAAGLVKNFAAEADAVLKEYSDELAEAQKHGKGEIGSKRAQTLHTALKDLAERATGYASMLGDRHVAELRTKLSVAANRIAESVDAISIRFENIFDELARDAARRGE